MNYNFLYTRFCAPKTIFGARLCTWKIVPEKEETCTLLIIAWHSIRKCTKLVLNPGKLKTASLFQSCILLLSCILYYFSLHGDYSPFLYTMWSIYRAAIPFLTNWNEKWCSKSNILTMNHELVLYYNYKDQDYCVEN